MSFRCLFILRHLDSDVNDAQPFCYKPFSSFNKSNDSNNSVNLPNFNDWYCAVLSTLSNKNYSQFNEKSINEYLSNPIYKITTINGDLWPCILISLSNFVFGGLLYCSSIDSSNMNDRCGRAVDFICGMSQYFMDIIKKSPKFKMMDLVLEFYHFIRVICPYGTPITSNMNLVDFMRSSEGALKSINIPSKDKGILSVNQIPSNINSKNKEIKITIEEIVTGVLHESRNGDMRHDIEIVGEISISALNLNINSEISMTITPSTNKKLFNKIMLIDLLLHPSCIACDFKSPANISMLSRKEFQGKNFEDSSSPCYSLNENSLVQKPSTIDNVLLSRRLQTINRNMSVNVELDCSKSTDINIKVKPWSETYTLLTYRFMQYSDDAMKQECNVPFVTSLRSPDPPIIGSYQFEDHSLPSDNIANIVLRLNLNTNVLPVQNKVVEFSNLEVIIPFPNRPPLLDISMCTVSQGKVTILEQNRHIVIWSLGTSFKNKSEASLIGSIRFSTEISKNPFVDPFCVGLNAYAQINFTLKSNNISGLSVDQRSFKCIGDRNIKFTQQQQAKSYNLKVWNSMGDCPMELQN